jgi:hypothetical protein
MKSSTPIRFAGDVSIDKAIIITPSGFYQDIAAQVINVQIYEDIFSPFITGSLIVKESLDLVNLFPFIGEEFLDIQISTPTLENKKINGRFYIYKLTDRELLGDRSVVYQLHFISQEAVVDLNKKLSKVFTGKVSDLVTNLVNGTVDGLETKKKVYIEPTSNSIKYISNFWSPVKNLSYLTQHALNDNKTPNYVFFENRDGFYFISLDSLYTTGVHQEFTYDRYTRDQLSDGKDVRNITQDYKRILEIKIPTGYDYIDRLRSGMLASRLISYDLTKKTYINKNYNMFQRFDKQKHLNKHAINSNNAIFRNSSVIMNIPRYYNNFSGFGDVTNYTYLQERVSLMKLAEANKLEITVPGRVDYTVGQKVAIVLNKIEPITKEEKDITDKMFSGYYLIAAINHYVDRDKHECNIELIKDSSQISMNRK